VTSGETFKKYPLGRRKEMDCDVVVVGAGPAGLMAAKTCGEENLKVVLVERKKDITTCTRADCMQFYGFDGNFLGEDIKVEPGKVVFPRNGFEVKYTGGLYPSYHWRVLSSGGHGIDFGSDDPIATFFDKDVLLENLLDEASRFEVDVLENTAALGGENTEGGVRVKVSRDGKESWITAQKAIAADGLNSRMAESLGLNEGRTSMGTFLVCHYILEGVDHPYPNSWIQFYGKSISPINPPHFHPTAMGEKRHKLGAMRLSPDSPEDDVKRFITNSRYAPWFKNVKIVGKMTAAANCYMPIAEPCKGHSLIIGDAAAFAEVENQGALMCGYRAGKSVMKELRGDDGFKEYVTWWQNSFEFLNPEIHRIAQGYLINPFYEDEEIDYLFSLAGGEPHKGTMNQYKFPKLLWDAILKHSERISKERPELRQKIDKIQNLTLEEGFKAPE
jgi:flavin-dependent dehydrogenase